MEEGLSEQDAVLSMGNIESVVSQILAEIPLLRIVKQKIKPKRQLSTWEIVLLSIGSPIWGALLISAFAVVFSLYVSIWAVLISIFAVEASFVCCAVGGVFVGAIFCFTNHLISGIFMFGASFVCAGLSIFLCSGCKFTTKSILLFTKKLMLWLKKCFIGKGAIK